MRSVLRVVKALGPKPAAELKALTALTMRQCEDIVAERSGISVPTLRLLLGSEIGFDILCALFEGDDGEPGPPEWLLDLRYHVQSSRLSAEIAEAKAQLKAERALRRAVRPRA